MSNIQLRKRDSRKQDSLGSSKMTDLSETTPNICADVKCSAQTTDRVKSTQKTPRTPTLLLLILGSILLAFGLRKARSDVVPKSYAICSKEGKIYTVDETKPNVECFVVHNKRILATGSLGEVRHQFGDIETTGPVSIGLSPFKNGLRFYFIKPGHIIVPGLTDAHAHLLEYGFKRQLETDNCNSSKEVIERVKDYINARPDIVEDRNIWIQGMGWDQTKWGPGAGFPTAAEFDAEPLLRGRPIVLRRVDGHALWVSSRVIKELGSLPDHVEGGAIIRYENGKPTGVFVDNAMALIKLPEWTENMLLQYYATAVSEALSFGLTSIHDAATDLLMIKFLKKMADQNKLPLRLYLMGYVESDSYWGDQIERFINYGPAGRLTLRAIKLFTDGALGSWGAALIEPYSDDPSTKGLLRVSPDAMAKTVKMFWDDDFQVNIHCIGDRANEVVLDIFEDLLKGANVTERRPRIEHSQIMTPEDLKRIGRLGVIPSVQPTHATSDMWYAESRLGHRVKYAYAYKTLLETSDNHVLPLGSDFPVESPNPLLGFYAAVSRLSINGDSPHGEGIAWFPEQRLTRAEALKGMTKDPAYASFNEEHLGSLVPGKLADFVVLDTDIMTVPASEILGTKVVATVIDGSPMYGKL